MLFARISGFLELQPGKGQKSNTRKPQQGEDALRKDYNEVLYHKLEEKSLQFEDANTRFINEAKQRLKVESELIRYKSELDEYLENDISAHFVSTPEGEIL